jgi:small GTP-binding protein
LSSQQKTQAFKVILLGDTSVGKTSILVRFQHGTFSYDLPSTVGASFFTKSFSVRDIQVNLSLWDTAGQERYRCLVPMYSRHCAAALIVFDASEELHFDSLEQWIQPVRLEAPDALIVIVGNKCDLPIAVDQRDIRNWAKKAGFLCTFVSALQGTGIQDLFNSVAMAVAAPTPTVLHPERRELSIERRSNSCCG